jgi:2-C-methyl-D-erythritol 4-phosphate cytidylyltransferase/2-C-methyl-D-erythritol 2,4-cyclodiphosphate synthase
MTPVNDDTNGPRIGTVLVAAGASRRVGDPTPKQFCLLGLEPMFVRALRPLLEVSAEVIIVAAADRVSTAEGLLREAGWPGGDRFEGTRVAVVEGGERRQDSVVRGLAALSEEVEVVLVHDAARPFVSRELVDRVVDAAVACGAAVPVAPVPDTVKRVEGRDVVATLDRAVLGLSQTPQGFRRAVLDEAYRVLGDAAVTDDAQAVEMVGRRVTVVEGDAGNVKVTTALDLETAVARVGRELGLEAGARVGTGSDTHRLVEGRKLVLAGVDIPFGKGLDGWSDADVAAHAVMDALLGAVAAGDIGGYFPPGDPAFRDVSSLGLLERVVAIVRERGHDPASVDVTIVAEAPKLAPHVPDMRRALAGALGVDEAAVSVKATTTEGTGPEGEGLAISAYAVAVVRARP